VIGSSKIKGQVLLGLAFVILLALSGCRSRVLIVTVENKTSEPIRNLDVEYPGGSYGVPVLRAGARHEYRIKPFFVGNLTLSYLDSTNQERHAAGPKVAKNDEGHISVEITQTVSWNPQIKHAGD